MTTLNYHNKLPLPFPALNWYTIEYDLQNIGFDEMGYLAGDKMIKICCRFKTNTNICTMLQKAAIFFLSKKSMRQRYAKQCKKKTWYMMFLTTFVFARRIGAFTSIVVVDNKIKSCMKLLSIINCVGYIKCFFRSVKKWDS